MFKVKRRAQLLLYTDFSQRKGLLGYQENSSFLTIYIYIYRKRERERERELLLYSLILTAYQPI